MTLVDRHEQLALLHSVLADSDEGAGRVVLVSGPIASGKTEVLQSWSEHAEKSGALVVSAVASADEQALPLAVIGQLVRHIEAPEQARRAVALLDEGIRLASTTAHDPGQTQAALAAVLHGLCVQLLDLAAERTVLISVDDVHHADELSLQCILYVARRMRRARMLLILTDRMPPQLTHPLLQGELLRQPHCRLMRLSLLPAGAVGELIGEHLGRAAADRLQRVIHDISGGNPLLVNALIEDHRATGPAPAAEPAIGDAFVRAVLSCLYRADCPVMATARAIAVLGDGARRSLVADVVGQGMSTVNAAYDTLTLAGLLRDDWFRHTAVRQAVLDSMTAGELTALHRRAAATLHGDGAASELVARHLALGGDLDEPWMVDVVHDAVEVVTARGDLRTALAHLRTAGRADTDEEQRLATTVNTAAIEWRVDPSTTTRHLAVLTAAVSTGKLSAAQTAVTVKQLMWHGYVDKAVDALRAGLSRMRHAASSSGIMLATVQLWLAFLYPDTLRLLADQNPPLFPAAAEPNAPPVFDQTTGASAQRLLRAVEGPSGPDAVTDLGRQATQILQHVRSDDTTIETVMVAISSLIHTDQLDAAAAWCDQMVAEEGPRAPMWQALFTAARASISGRQGDLITAEDESHQALSLMSDKGWGVALGWPLATGALVSLARGCPDRAAEYLNVPVPEALFRTPFGLHYLRARGQHHLAAGRYEAAVRDHLMCGERMRRWNMDSPAVIPWRSDAAAALTALGRPDEARRLVEEQLTMGQPAQSRVRGISLRALAEVTDRPQVRLSLLREAAEHFADCGNRAELAGTLAALSSSSRALGRINEADTLARRAHEMAVQCGAAGLAATLTDENPRPQCGRTVVSDIKGRTADLSDAERRVAALAARGFTNRQIASELYVSVSTVEQHLTRVYRKLEVSRRTDLPPWLVNGQAPQQYRAS